MVYANANAVTDLAAAVGTADGALEDVTVTPTQGLVNDNFQDLAEKVNEILAALRSRGVIR